MRPKSQMSDEERIQDFQRKLYLKAKQEKGFRFYVLYDKVRRTDFVREAYKRVKRNGGSAGVDGVSIEEIERIGAEEYIKGIQKELEERRYKPQPVKRVNIPKENGKMRPLGIPTIKDRIVQMSCKMVIEPIFEADFEDSSYGFRANRSAGDAIRNVKENLERGNTEILDADISSYFDTIPHDKLMESIGRRIADRNVIHLIKMWLKAPIIEGKKITGGKKNKKGTPQGGVISPLLANIYLDRLDKEINKTGEIFKRYNTKIVRYADDFILMGKEITKEIKEEVIEILKGMELSLNYEKSRVIKATEGSFDFLGFTIRYDKDIYGRDKKYINIIPSEKSCKRFREKIKRVLNSKVKLCPKEIVRRLNYIIRGWGNYYKGKGTYPKVKFRDNWWYVRQTIYRYYIRKSQRKSKLYRKSNACEILKTRYGLIDFKTVLAGSLAKA